MITLDILGCVNFTHTLRYLNYYIVYQILGSPNYGYLAEFNRLYFSER